ncbi:MAG: glycosyltransferase [Candidatus Eisenbacteria bacterium]|nr:glycosyltransferase [Candidatus Eisenbacteria bacterium]
MRVTFFLGPFPIVSETFIVDQIMGLIARGHDVRIHAQAPRPAQTTISPIPAGQGTDSASRPAQAPDAALPELGLRERTLYRPTARSHRFGRALQTAGLALRHIGRAPVLTLRALDAARYGRAAASGQILRALIPLLVAEREGRRTGIVHAHFGPIGALAAALQEIGAFHAPLVATFHGYDVHVFPRQRGPRYYARLFDRAARIMVGTQFMRERVIALGAPSEKIAVLPMGVDLERFAFHVRAGRADRAPVVFSVGRLIAGKGFEDGLRAFRLVLRAHPRARYWIVGEGPLRPRLEEIASRELEIGHAVRFLGRRSPAEVAELYRQADLFLHPAKVAPDGWVESQGVVLAEASATGLPIVATRAGGIPESVEDQQSGFLVPPGDDEQMAARVSQLLDDAALRGEMGRRGRRLVAERFDRAKLTERLIRIYEEALR